MSTSVDPAPWEAPAILDGRQRAAEAEPGPPVPSIQPWTPFPVGLLPEVLGRFVHETAAAIGCDAAHVALPALAVVASCVGTTREIELKGSWREPAVLWTVLIARSGSQKSPPLDAALEPLRCVQSQAFDEHKAAVETHKTDRLEYEVALATWKRDRAKGDTGAGEPPAEPEVPHPVRYIVSDITTEALAPILEANPRGVLLARDELAGWVRGFNQYKKGHGGDAEGWLELHRAGTLIVDRKSTGTIHIRRAACSVCGTIQPGTAARVLTADYMDSGFVGRLLLARPPDRQKRWTNRVPSSAVLGGYERLIRDLLALEHVEGDYEPEPVRLRLTDAAAARWQAWYDVHAERIADAGTDALAAALAKIEAAAARFALIFQLAHDPVSTEIRDDAMGRGTALADWFAHEAERVYGLLAESDEDRSRRQLVELIQRKGGSVSVRDWQRIRSHATAADAETELNELVVGGHGRWERPAPGPKGGKPTKHFILTPDGSDTDDTFPDGPENEGIVSVSSVRDLDGGTA